MADKDLSYCLFREAVRCPCTGKIANGTHSGSRLHGGTMSITCNTGFRTSGTNTLNCVNGKWDSPVPQCVGKITVKSSEAMILTVMILIASITKCLKWLVVSRPYLRLK